MNRPDTPLAEAKSLAPFSDSDWTANGERRAGVTLKALETLWFNTGTLCNIECTHCYILSSPTNDDLVYLTAAEAERYLDEIADLGLPTREIGFTGGEPFMNPDMCAMADAALKRGFVVLILTNAMRPMMRPRVQQALSALIDVYGEKLTIRISMDHPAPAKHDDERGKGSFAASLDGMRWLRDQGATMAVAGRTMWGDAEADMREGFAKLFRDEGFEIDPYDPSQLVLFPEMDETAEVPEITESCWGILNKSPDTVMCSNARMVVKRKGAERPAVLACTLLAYDRRFELGETLAEAAGEVKLNHPHCAKFCVLGGASCSG